MKDELNPKTLTLLAFLVGFALVDNLNSTEQNALGGWFMLVGQTLSTSSALTLKKEHKAGIYKDMPPESEFSISNMMNQVKDAIDKSISKL